ncbi:hypothetical protein BS78_01G286900 [Paspalum vaginatum]|nr:hypothetical protein BS78_01G286900 [Paspalum vaginatum]
MVLQVWEVLDANKTARRAYERVLARPTMLEVTKNVICLLIWLERIKGANNILTEVSTVVSSDRLSQAVMEADAIYNFLLHGQDMPSGSGSIPTIVSLCGGGRLIDLRFFKFHKELIARGVSVIRDNIGALVFNDGLHAMMQRFGDDANPSVLAPELTEPFTAVSRTPPEDSRVSFIAFSAESHPCPLSPKDITNYYEQVLLFGRCIERVEIEPALEGQTPKHGIIVFMSPKQKNDAMMNETAIFFRMSELHDVWVQPYMPPF